jgi:hypothetical protein
MFRSRAAAAAIFAPLAMQGIEGHIRPHFLQHAVMVSRLTSTMMALKPARRRLHSRPHPTHSDTLRSADQPPIRYGNRGLLGMSAGLFMWHLPAEADALDLPVEINAGRLLHLAADSLAQFFDLCGGGATFIDQEVAVQFRHLGRAPRQSRACPPCRSAARTCCSGGFLKVEPPVRLFTGWVASRLSVILSMAARMSAVTPGRPAGAPA